MWIGLLEILLVFGSAGHVYSGAFIDSGEANGVDMITHPTGYTGTGGDLEVTVCIDPSSANAADMETSLKNIVRTFNDLEPTTGNILSGNANNIPAGQIDFESIVMHELGHCVGLGHPNFVSNYTISTDGANNVFDLDDGADNVIGSSDDIRGDDVNLHWFRKSNNNPFTIAGTVDSTTYSRDLADLPNGHSFAVNGNRNAAELLLFPNTEAVMHAAIFSDEVRRQLTHDDVATISYAMAGLDETAGTADDYDLILSYAGMTNSCDIVLDFDDSETGFAAVCRLSSQLITATHGRIASAQVFFNSGFNWFFNEISNTVTLTVNKAGNGSGTVTSNPTGIDCGTDCSATYTKDSSVTLTATAATGSIFSGWSGGGCSGTGSCVVTMNSSITVTATFNKITRTLTVIKVGAGSGTVTSNPAGINCGSTCSASFDSGTSVTLTASPVSGFAFAGWTGGGCSGTSTCTVTLNANTLVTATFSLVFTLTVTKAGSADGTVTSSPAGINCGSDCTEDYTNGASVTLTASPNGGSTFKAWSGACTGTGTCTVTMNAVRSVTATYSKKFTDDPLTSKVTFVKAIHFLEALEAINTLRQRNGLGTISFTAPIPAAAGLGEAHGTIIVPAGLKPGDPYHLVFLTRDQVNGQTLGIDFYNQFVNDQANLAGALTESFGIQWFVIASTPNVNARDNAKVRAPVYLLNGNLVATGESDMWDGSIANPIQLSQFGVSFPEHVYTGSRSDGTGLQGRELGKSIEGNLIAAGRSELSNLGWINVTNGLASANRVPLYALSERLGVIFLGVPISAKDMITLQTGINAVYDALGRTRPTFDSIVRRVTVVGKRQMEQVRNAIRAVESLSTN